MDRPITTAKRSTSTGPCGVLKSRGAAFGRGVAGRMPARCRACMTPLGPWRARSGRAKAGGWTVTGWRLEAGGWKLAAGDWGVAGW
jgi:hypothetical protein